SLMWPYDRAARSYSPVEAWGYLPLRCGQRVHILHSEEGGWYFGSRDDGDPGFGGSSPRQKRGWFPSEVLLGPPPPWLPPEFPPASKDFTDELPSSLPESLPASCRHTSAKIWQQHEAAYKFPASLPKILGQPQQQERCLQQEQGGCLQHQEGCLQRQEVQGLPLSPLGLSLQIVTLGLEVAGIRNLTPQAVADGLHAYHLSLGSPLGPAGCSGFDFCLDARCFGDPWCGPLKRHIGTHPEIVTRLVGSEDFPPWLSCAQVLFQQAVDRSQRPRE
ncbi:unnamed protein product, partial [Polarella glacialis]